MRGAKVLSSASSARVGRAGNDLVDTVRKIIRVRKGQLSNEERDGRRLIMETFRACGRAPTSSEIAERLRVSEERAMAVLRRLDEADVVYLEDDQIAAAYPFSNKPTKHVVTFNKTGTAAYSMCAIDALGIPFMFREAVTISSTCGFCNKSIEAEVDGRRIHSDKGVVVFFGFERSRHAATSSCPVLQFFCSDSHLVNWRAENPARIGEMLSLTDAADLAEEIFGGMLNFS